jgi:hypothetical protein
MAKNPESVSHPSDTVRENLPARERALELAQAVLVATQLGDFEGVLRLSQHLNLVAEVVLSQERNR